jgi:hypothetical protein
MPVDLYASRVLSVQTSSFSGSIVRRGGQLCRYSSSGQLPLFNLPYFALKTVLLLMRCRLRERLPLIAIPGSHKGEGWLRACDQSFLSPGTAALTLSHARSQRHDQTCRPLSVTAPRALRKLGTSLPSRSHPSQRTGSDAQGG